MSAVKPGSERDTVYRFFSRLRLSEKRAAAAAVGISINHDCSLTDFQQHKEFLMEVKREGKMAALADHINRVLGDRPVQDPSA